MKYLILAILITGCGIELETGVPESADVEVLVPELKRVDGKTFIRVGDWCMNIDERVEYPDAWTGIYEFDGHRPDTMFSIRDRYICEQD